jgi:predicted homoserine dehydrogenase-like protein
MIIVDAALRAREAAGNPIRVAMIGAGFMAEGCRLRRDLPSDTVLTYADVELPAGRLSDRLRTEQDRHLFG